MLILLSRSRAGVAGSGGASFPLASGHWIAAKQALRVVYPRPDSETNTWARHRKAYYDGSNPMEYRIPLGVQYGAYPYKFEKIAGPSWLSIGQYHGDANYGVAYGTPTGSLTNETVTFRVTDQQLNTIDVTWTLSTSSSTGDFVFVDDVNGNDTTGDGSITNPFQTLQKVFGAATLTTLHPNAIIVLRAGTYDGYAQTGASNFGIQFKSGTTGMALIGFPGESVSIDMTNSGVTSQFNTDGANGNDLFFQNFTLLNHPTTGNWRPFYMGQTQHRVTFDGISYPDAYRGSNASDNATTFFFNSPGGTLRNYIFINDCEETNRGATGGGGNHWGLCCLFVCRYVLVQGCRVLNSSAERNLYMKASCQDVTVRENICPSSAIVTGCQVDAGIDNDRLEYCYNVSNKLIANGEFTGAGAKTHWFYRNTSLSNMDVKGDNGSNGPFVLEDNVIQAASGNPLQNGGTNNPPGSQTTNTGTECQGSSGIIDTGTYLLIGTYRTNYLRRRGAEIA